MGTCLTVGTHNVDPNDSELPSASKALAHKISEFTPDEQNKLHHCIVVLQSHLRRIRTRKSLETERKKMIDAYNKQITSNPNICKITESDLIQAIPPSVASAISLFTSEAKTLIQNGVISTSDVITINTSKDSKPHFAPLTSFFPSPIKDNATGEIYDGSMRYLPKEEQFAKCGNATIITKKGEVIKCSFPRSRTKPSYINANIFYTNGDIFCGAIENDSPYTHPLSGTFLHKSTVNNSYVNNAQYDKANNLHEQTLSNVHITYPNGDVYTGEGMLAAYGPSEVVAHGEGELKSKEDGSSYQGMFRNGKQHGKGVQYVPFEKGERGQGYGVYYVAMWVNGMKSGNGVVKTRSKDGGESVEKCLFRFDKVIRRIQQIGKENVKLHPNVLEFLDFLEMGLLARRVKTKSLLEMKRDVDIRKKMNFALMMYEDEMHAKNKSDKNYKVNKKLLNQINRISNIDELLSNHNDTSNTHHRNQFLPFFAYETNGGIVETRFHYNNIFNPDRLKTYTTHYLLNCSKDINIIGAFNLNLYNQYSKGNNIDEYKKFYKKAETSSYLPIEKYRKDINEQEHILRESFIGNVKNIAVSIHSLNVFIPKLFDIYSLCNSPCNFLAVYIGMHKDEIKNENIPINEQLIRDASFDLKGLYLQQQRNDIPILAFHENNKFAYIEYDTLYNGDSINNKCAKLLCVVQIKEFFNADYDNVDCNIELQKFYHMGNYVNVKLISQHILPNLHKKVCIDFGTIAFYGNVITF